MKQLIVDKKNQFSVSVLYFLIDIEQILQLEPLKNKNAPMITGEMQFTNGDWLQKCLRIAVKVVDCNKKVKNEKRKSSRAVCNRGNEVKDCEGIPSFFSAANHSAGARDTKTPVCGLLFVCVLNGATGPPLNNEARPFAVTPLHQEDREARSEGRNKKAGSEKEKEGERGRIKNGGEKTEWERRV